MNMKTNNGTRVIFLAAALTLCTTASAQESDPYDMSKPGLAIAGRWYISPMLSYTFADNKRDADDGIGGALLIGKPIAPGVNLEAHVFYTEFDLESGGGKIDLTGIGADVMAFPFGNGLFGLAGLAFSDGDSDAPVPVGQNEPSADSIVGDLGLGYLFGPFKFLNDGGVRAEARGRFDKRTDDNTDDYFEPVLSVGLLYPFGAPPAPPAPATETPPVDVVPVQAPVDSDGDGVPDDLDQCPGTPAGTVVDASGCPIVSKSTDLACGQEVDFNKVGEGDKLALRCVNFDFDKAVLKPEAKATLDGVTDSELFAAPEIKFEVGGHTDEIGTDEYNQQLSEQRASAVSKYLKAGGVTPGRISERGYGRSMLLDPSGTEEARARNRRVELTVSKGEGAASAAPAPEAAVPAEPVTEAPAADAPAPEATTSEVPAATDAPPATDAP